MSVYEWLILAWILGIIWVVVWLKGMDRDE